MWRSGWTAPASFVEMARAESGCEVWHQDFLALDLPAERFDGIFANASLFHVPRAELPRVLRELHAALKPAGVLFCSNPRGSNEEGWNGGRYGVWHDLEAWRALVTAPASRSSSTTTARPASPATSSPGSPPSGASDGPVLGTCSRTRPQNSSPNLRSGSGSRR